MPALTSWGRSCWVQWRATWEHEGAAKLRHEVAQISDELVHATEGHDEIAIAGDIECGDSYLCAGEGC